jgi:hypothetical protein
LFILYEQYTYLLTYLPTSYLPTTYLVSTVSGVEPVFLKRQVEAGRRLNFYVNFGNPWIQNRVFDNPRKLHISNIKTLEVVII